MKLPIHLSGVERMFASESAVTDPIARGIPPAVARVKQRAPGRFTATGTPSVHAASTNYGYLATVVVPVRYDPAHVEELRQSVSATILENAQIRERVAGSPLSVRFT